MAFFEPLYSRKKLSSHGPSSGCGVGWSTSLQFRCGVGGGCSRVVCSAATHGRQSKRSSIRTRQGCQGRFSENTSPRCHAPILGATITNRPRVVIAHLEWLAVRSSTSQIPSPVERAPTACFKVSCQVRSIAEDAPAKRGSSIAEWGRLRA